MRIPSVVCDLDIGGTQRAAVDSAGMFRRLLFLATFFDAFARAFVTQNIQWWLLRHRSKSGTSRHTLRLLRGR